jgi:hypothetical protein
MSSLDHAGDAVDLVATAVNAVGLVEYGVFVEDLVDRFAPAHGINLSEHVMEVAKQQGRYSVGHGFSRIDVGPPWLLSTGRVLTVTPEIWICGAADIAESTPIEPNETPAVRTVSQRTG